MMNSIAPFWDGNETWLVLGGGGLFAAFPLAYAVLMPALYIPVIIMLLGLIFRGVAFEFRFKAVRSQRLWDYAFHFGSLVTAFSQGVIIGAAVQGVAVAGRRFAGGPFDWLNAYSVMTGVALIFGYALLGGTWLIMKTEDVTQAWARKVAAYVLGYVGLFLAIVSISMPMMNSDVAALWYGHPTIYYLLPVPVVTALLFARIWWDLRRGSEYGPFLLSIGIFLMGYLGIGLSLWPYIVPFAITFRQAAAAPESQSLLLVGAVVMLPVVLAYTAYCYYTFRGKASHESAY
jgi:cytochrome bd ubiquinol oxidase subunit II